VKLSTDKTSPIPLLPGSIPGGPESLAAASNRSRIPPPKKSWNFLPDLIAQPPTEEDEAGGPYDYVMRKELKPLHIMQPEGVSFKMDGHVLEWQGWKMHICG
jgi:primary-amine oxidase